jgi:hypothetical protein
VACVAGPDWLVEVSGEWLLAYRRLVLLDPKLELYREFLAQASAIASAIAPKKPQADEANDLNVEGKI